MQMWANLGREGSMAAWDHAGLHGVQEGRRRGEEYFESSAACLVGVVNIHLAPPSRPSLDPYRCSHRDMDVGKQRRLL